MQTQRKLKQSHQSDESQVAADEMKNAMNNALVRVAQHRDKQAFAELFNHYAPLIKAFAIARTSYTNSDELVQEVMLKVWNKASYFDRDKASATTWIYTLARNCHIDLMRRGKKHQAEPIETADIWDFEEEDESPLQKLQAARDSERVTESMRTLPKEQAEILKKVYIEGRTHSEAAEELDLPLGTVKSRVRLAIEKLRTQIRSL